MDENNLVMEDINYWMSKCVSLQQELDIANEKLANVSIIHWKTGEPKENGEYLVTTNIETVLNAWWNGTSWLIGNMSVDIEYKAWCKLSDIKPYKEKKDENV